MSKIKAALITAILGTSSAALAQPTISFTGSASARLSWSTPSAPIVRDHTRAAMPAYAMPSTTSSWISLANYLDLSSGRDLVRTQSNLRASSLSLRATRGMAYVQKVTVKFHDGSTQIVNLNKWMTTRNAAVEVSLRGNKKIASITITGTATARGTQYQLFAQGAQNVELPHPPVYQPPVYQPPVYQPPVYQPPVQHAGLELGRDMSFLGTDGRRFLNVGFDKGAFATLRLEGSSGSTYVQMVKIEFTNGQEQFMGAINKTLGRGQILDLPLDGNGQNHIQQIVVWTSDRGQPITGDTGSFNASVL